MFSLFSPPLWVPLHDMFILQFISGASMSSSFYIIENYVLSLCLNLFIHLFMGILIISGFGCYK